MFPSEIHGEFGLDVVLFFHRCFFTPCADNLFLFSWFSLNRVVNVLNQDFVFIGFVDTIK